MGFGNRLRIHGNNQTLQCVTIKMKRDGQKHRGRQQAFKREVMHPTRPHENVSHLSYFRMP
jgi:hypothetical protein